MIDYPRKRKANNPGGRTPVVHTHCSQEVCRKPLVTPDDIECAKKRGGRCVACYHQYQSNQYKARKAKLGKPQKRKGKIESSETVTAKLNAVVNDWGPAHGFASGGDRYGCSTLDFTRKKMAERARKNCEA